MYELVIGGWGNTQSAVRESIQGEPQVQLVNTPNIVSCTEMVELWVSWQGGHIQVSTGSVSGMTTVMQWQDTEDPVAVTAVSLTSGYPLLQVTAYWKLSGRPKLLNM